MDSTSQELQDRVGRFTSSFEEGMYNQHATLIANQVVGVGNVKGRQTLSYHPYSPPVYGVNGRMVGFLRISTYLASGESELQTIPLSETDLQRLGAALMGEYVKEVERRPEGFKAYQDLEAWARNIYAAFEIGDFQEFSDLLDGLEEAFGLTPPDPELASMEESLEEILEGFAENMGSLFEGFERPIPDDFFEEFGEDSTEESSGNDLEFSMQVKNAPKDQDFSIEIWVREKSKE
jgi:hypothetical protein